MLIAPVLLLNACTSAPYVDARREAGQTAPVGTSTPDVVAICYSSRKATPEEVLKLAESECAKTGRTARMESEVSWSCTLAAPTRAFYRCVAKPPEN